MNKQAILTIAVPTFNMAHWLEKNLVTYWDERLDGRLEVIGLNNASEDSSGEIIARFAAEYPGIFVLVNRDSRGYGSSINGAIEQAKGRYFRIVDADDWVDTEELVKLVDALEGCTADVVLTDYRIVNMQDGSQTPIQASDKGVIYGKVYCELGPCIRTLPSIHNTTYSTALLQESGFYMQDNMFFVDEEYVMLPYLQAESAIYYPFDVYRYQVDNPGQSTSPRNRAKFFEHRENVLRRMIAAYLAAEAEGESPEALHYCFERIKNGIGDHFTTLNMYVEDRAEGRRLVKKWTVYVRTEASAFWPFVKKKALLLSVLNRLGVSLPAYEALKKTLLKSS